MPNIVCKFKRLIFERKLELFLVGNQRPLFYFSISNTIFLLIDALMLLVVVSSFFKCLYDLVSKLDLVLVNIFFLRLFDT